MWLALLLAVGYVLPDPGYADRGPPGDPARRHVGPVVYPTMGFPALVPYGGELELVLRAADPQAPWRIEVQSGGVNYPVRVVSATADGGFIRVRGQVSARAPRDVYDLAVEHDGWKDLQPRAVRVYGESAANLRFALMSDHQLWDPSWKQRAGDQFARKYPWRGEKDANRAIERQVRHELALLDPDFVLDAGDFVFGLDYAKEYDELYEQLRHDGFASFKVPGNHDGYAIYEVRLKKDLVAMARAGLACRNEVAALASKTTASWGAAWRALECVYGNVKELLYQELARDGLVAWRRMIGPPYYAFDVGPLHVVALDTYDGSPERRHAFAVALDAFDLHLGAPAVDNYGGYLSDAQLAWLEADLARAAAAGKTIVVFGHHDPRGNSDGERYSANLPFPTDPLSLGGFKEWQFDSDWGERAGKESASEHSGTRLLRLLAKYASAYLSGHMHADEQRAFERGQEIASGVRAERHIDFVRVTAAAGAPKGPGVYWGYRLLEAGAGRIVAQPYDATRQMLSVPAGNLWSEETAERKTVVNGQDRPVEVTLRWKLPERPEGWRFFLEAAPAVDLPLSDVGDGGWAFVRVRAPGAQGGRETRSVYVAQPAAGNHPPQVAVDPGELVAGRVAHLSAARTVDPDAGDGVLAILWTLPDGSTARGQTVDWTPGAPGSGHLVVEAIDHHGARSRANVAVHIDPPAAPPPGARPPGWGCQIGSAWGDVAAGAVILSLLAGIAARVRRFARARRLQ